MDIFISISITITIANAITGGTFRSVRLPVRKYAQSRRRKLCACGFELLISWTAEKIDF